MNMDQLITSNVNTLRSNKYPGRGIVIGMTPSKQNLVQVYWTMGRSENSRNRVFELEGDFVKNKAFDESKMTDPSLIIYYPLKKASGIHIVTNGDQTETIWEGIWNDCSFEQSLETREYEPDPPHFTPRISGLIDISTNGYKLSILKSSRNRPEVCIRNFYNYNHFTAGEGHCIHTYSEERDGTLRSFVGEPFEVPLFDSIEEVRDFYWNLLDRDNRISLLVKFIDAADSQETIAIVNKYEARGT